MRIFDDQNNVYETQPVGKIIAQYLKRINLKDNEFWESEDIPITPIRYIFLFSIHDYKNKKITLDDLSTIAGNIYWGQISKWSPNKLISLDKKLANLLDNASELSYNNWKKNNNYVINTIRNLYSYLDNSFNLIEPF